MVDQPDGKSAFPDPMELTQAMASIAEKSQALVTAFLKRQTAQEPGRPAMDPMNIGGAFMELTTQMMTNPTKLVQAQMGLWQDYVNLWQSTAQRAMGQEAPPVIAPQRGDRRFRDQAWDENLLFDYIKQSYLLTARWMQNTVSEAEGLDSKTAQKVDFYTRQFVDALAPSNFVMTNPEVLRTTMETRGENLVKGLDNLLTDLERGEGSLRVRQTDEEAFEVGRNVAITPGKVIYQNELMQLLQFDPATDKVYKRPLLIIPPWINKYYILDLRPDNSLIKWCTEQGFTVFVASWVNPDHTLAAKTFEDYMLEGPLAAIDAVEQATGERKINIVGYCLGGTLLAATLSYMAARHDDRCASATFLVTMTDFEEAGELSVFIDEEQLASLDQKMNDTGYLEGSEMANTFNMLRANDLIWSFVVSNYLLGKDPFPFDLLYWNSDSTHMPAAMHIFYLRKMYQENLLVVPGGIELAGVPIDISQIETPTFILSTREDHIAPWKSTYAATQIFSGPVTFCLADSGHIAGVVNPPAAGKYHHWTATKTPNTPDAWLNGAVQHDGSWWPAWKKWLAKHSGAKIPARHPGDGDLAPIEDAPGSYVKVRA